MAHVSVSTSTSRAVLDLIEGPLRRGAAIGSGYVELGGYVLALVPPGLARMPNGIVCDLKPVLGEPVYVGEGRVETTRGVVTTGPTWEPVARPSVMLDVSPSFVPNPLELAGRGEGLTPSGDDLLAGYVAGLVLWHGRTADAEVIAEVAATRTTALAATLLRHAARGELPEPAHALLQRGDPVPLQAFGRSSGSAMLVGLALGCLA